MHEVLREGVRRGNREGRNTQALEARAVAIDDDAEADLVALDAGDQAQLAGRRGAGGTRDDREGDLDAASDLLDDRRVEGEDRDTRL